MTSEPRALRSVEQAQKQAAERAHARLAQMRRELAQRDAARAELAREDDALAARLAAARTHSSEAGDVLSLRWAHDHTQALETERRLLGARVAALETARAELARTVRTAEKAFTTAEVARRAVGTVIERRERALERARELREEDLLADAARSRPR